MYFRKIGEEKLKKFNNNFDELYDKYKQKSINLGFSGDLKIVKEHGKVIFLVILPEISED